MNSFKMPLLKVIGLLALAMLLAAGCSETPEEPDANIAPNTFITSYNIEIAPDSSVGSSVYYTATVYWRGSDPDGETQEYRYWLGSDEPTETSATSVQLSLDFSTSDTSYTFNVQARDNANAWDATPATIDIRIDRIRDVEQFPPSTAAVTVPPNGASTSRGVPFIISGEDIDGIVSGFEWAVDDISNDTLWTSATPDVITVSSSSATIVLTPADLSLGAHTIYFRAVDNNGNSDPSPLSVSINCVTGFAPELSLSVKDGHSFVVPFTAPTIETLEISMSVLVDFYYGLLDGFDIITSEGDTINTTEMSFTMTNLSSGSYWVKVTANDVGGNSTVDSTNFAVVELAAGDGILCVNGIDWATYGSQAANLWTSGAPWGNRTSFKCWDLMDAAPLGSLGDFADSLLGTGTPPLWMFDTTFFDAVSWAYNNYAGDDAYWEDADLQAAIVAYLEMGGNLFIGGRLGEYIFEASDGFSNYCGYSDYAALSNPSTAVAIHDSLSDMGTVRSMSYTRGIITTHANVTQLLETDGGESNLGWVITPNGEGGGGAVCYFGGRIYGWANADLKANLDVVFRYWFGIN